MNLRRFVPAVAHSHLNESAAVFQPLCCGQFASSAVGIGDLFLTGLI
jgi:hypothetical protein